MTALTVVIRASSLRVKILEFLRPDVLSDKQRENKKKNYLQDLRIAMELK